MTTLMSLSRPRITFSVDDVTPATKPLPTRKLHVALGSMVEGKLESCSDYHTDVVLVGKQALLCSVVQAFLEHRPLVITPDAVWITILQGVAHHMVVHAERLRPQFVQHQGRKKLTIDVRDWVPGTPENPWREAFEGWTAMIRQHVGAELHDALLCDFSTTGPDERTVSQIAMMDIFERYFHYEIRCICGIPTITLEGAPADWQRLADKVTHLKRFDFDWWLEPLSKICGQFVRASQGDIDRHFWQRICQPKDAYGGEIINGWIAQLFPYVRAYSQGPCTLRNSIFETGEGFQLLEAPSGLSTVPFTWRGPDGQERSMEAIGGLVGLVQDPETLALEARAGWGVRPTSEWDSLLAQLEREHSTFPGKKFEDPTTLPEDLCSFYAVSNGAQLFPGRTGEQIRILPVEAITPLDWGERPAEFGTEYHWHRFGELADGSWLAMDLSRNVERPPQLEADFLGWRRHPICLTRAETVGRRGRNPVIALHFRELLTRLFKDGPRYWEAPGFHIYADAHEFMRPEDLKDQPR